MPTPTPVPVDNIIGLWETYYNSIYGHIDFFENGTLKYDEGGHFLSGVWSKIDNTHYIIDIGKGGPKEIILNDEMTRFHINGSKLIYTKKAVPTPTQAPSPTQTPSPTSQPTVTPAPTPTPVPVDNIIGLWEGYHNSIHISIEFFLDETLAYNEGGNRATGWWKKKQIIHNISLPY